LTTISKAGTTCGGGGVGAAPHAWPSRRSAGGALLNRWRWRARDAPAVPDALRARDDGGV